MSEVWVAAAVAVVGAGASVYGANKQAKASKDANAANAAQVQASNDYSWSNYLAQRGVMPTGPVTAGQMPSSSVAVNSRLPLWANVSANGTGGPVSAGGFLRRTGTQTGGYSLDARVISSPASSAGAGAAAGGGGNKVKDLLMRPLNPKTAWDPLGLFG